MPSIHLRVTVGWLRGRLVSALEYERRGAGFEASFRLSRWHVFFLPAWMFTIHPPIHFLISFSWQGLRGKAGASPSCLRAVDRWWVHPQPADSQLRNNQLHMRQLVVS